MKKIKINGKDYPVAFSFNALNELCELKNCSFTELTELLAGNALLPNDLVIIAFVGLKEGARKEKEKFDLTIDDVDELLFQNMSLIAEIMEAFQLQTSAPKNQQAPRVGAISKKAKK